MSRCVLLRVAGSISWWEMHARLEIWLFFQFRVERVPRCEERMGIGTLMATVWWAYWVANAVAFQEAWPKPRRQRELFSACCIYLRISRCKGARELGTVASGNGGGSDAKLLPGCSCSGAWPWDAAIIIKAQAPPNRLGRQHGPLEGSLPALGGTGGTGGCPRHIPTGYLGTSDPQHTATLA